ncbi:hypothetical protein IWQ49_004438 [Labrenzia sp. EL_126]|nr:hypothetical protein [Labrenzia sp. EL_126]
MARTISGTAQTFEGFVILNAHGAIWTQHVFPTERHATRHLESATEVTPTLNLSKHTVVPVEAIIEFKDTE